MLDISKSIVSALSDILPVYYELFDGETETPCITYQEYNNYDTAYGDTFGYSHIQFMIKIWGESISNIQTKVVLVDAAMRELGFHRVSSGELVLDNEICKQLLYEAQAKETY